MDDVDDDDDRRVVRVLAAVVVMAAPAVYILEMEKIFLNIVNV